MTIFEFLCIAAAAVYALFAAGRLVLDQVRDAAEALQPTGVPVDPGTAGAEGSIECPECRHRYVATSVVCPFCGEPPKVRHAFPLVPLFILGFIGLVYTGSFTPELLDDGSQRWSHAPAFQKLRSALISELQRENVINAVQVTPHVVTVELQQPAFRALRRFEQDSIGGAVFGYYFDGSGPDDYVALEDVKTHQSVGWFNRWGLHLVDAVAPSPAPPAAQPKAPAKALAKARKVVDMHPKTVVIPGPSS